MTEESEERPPVFHSWKGWYGVVISVLVLQLLLYFLITTTFA